MTMRMNETRFARLLDVYGAQAQLWPEAERAQALLFARDHAEIADRLIAEARQTDDLLGLLAGDAVTAREDRAAEQRALAALLPLQSHDAEKREHAVRQNIFVLPQSGAQRRKSGQPLFWWTGVGLAACVAGAVVGAHLSLMSIGDLRAQTVLAQAQIIDGDSN